MVKLPPGSFMIPFRGAALRGQFYTREVNGRLYAARWPRSQKTARTAREADNRQLLKLAASITKYMSPQEQQFSRELAKATKLSARDLLMISLFNRIGVVVLRDGRKIFTMASIQDVSAILDALGQTPGDLLVRGDPFWTNIPKGANGTFLSINEDGDFEWVEVGGGGGGGYFTGMTGAPDFTGGNTTSAFATKGFIATARTNLSITAMGWFVDQAGSGDTYRGVVADANPSTGVIGSTINLTPTHSSGSTDPRAIRTAFSTPVTLTAGQAYFFGLQVTSGSGTTAARCAAAGLGFYPHAPVDVNMGLVAFNKNSLATGDTPSATIATEPQTIWYMVWPEGSSI